MLLSVCAYFLVKNHLTARELSMGSPAHLQKE